MYQKAGGDSANTNNINGVQQRPRLYSIKTHMLLSVTQGQSNLQYRQTDTAGRQKKRPHEHLALVTYARVSVSPSQLVTLGASNGTPLIGRHQLPLHSHMLILHFFGKAVSLLQ